MKKVVLILLIIWLVTRCATVVNFVAVGIGTKHSIATSVDGSSWIGRGITALVTGQGVVYSLFTRLWIACGTGTNTLATSVNGITWTGQGNSVFSS